MTPAGQLARAVARSTPARKLIEAERQAADREARGAWLFAVANTAVFLVLAASALGAAIVYGQGL